MISRLTGVFKKGSIIRKIILCYGVVLLLMCATGVIFCCAVKNVLTARELSGGEEYLRSLSMLMDRRLTEVHNLSYSFLTNGDNINRMNNTENVGNRYRLGIELNHLLISAEIADKVFLYNKNKPLVCSDEGVFRQNTFMCEAYGWSEDAMQKLNNALAKNRDYVIFAPSDFLGDADSGDITMIIATGVGNDNSTRLIITVNDVNYRRLLPGGSRINGELYIIDKAGGILFRQNADADGKDVVSAVAGSRQKNGNIRAGDNFVLWCGSNFFQGTYIRVLPVRNVNGIVRGISISLVAACVLLMLIGIAALPALLKIAYMPIYNILSYFRSLFGDTAEVTNEYTYIVSGLDAISSQMRANNDSMLLYDYLHNGYWHEEIDAMFGGKYFAAAVVRARSAELAAAFETYMKAHGGDVKYFAMNKQRYAVIMSMDTEDMSGCKSYLAQMLREVVAAAGDRLVAAVSDALAGAEKLNLLYRRAELACNNAAVSDIGELIEYNNAAEPMQGQLYFSDSMENYLICAVKNGQRESVQQYLDELFEKNAGISLYLLEILKMRLLNLYFKTGMLLSKPVDYRNDLLECEYDPGEIKREFAAMLDALTEAEPKDGEALSRTQKLMVEYIDTNYSSAAINIDMLAEYLNLSVPYTSKLFKQTTGQTFKEYLINKRVEEAKRLMSETTYSIKEISELVGAGTYNSFVRMFKNKVGISPGQYRSIGGED